LETVPCFGGILYRDATDEGLRDAVAEWEAREQDLDSRALQAWASKFSEAEFAANVRAILGTRENSKQPFLMEKRHEKWADL
jgi:hypothetical protein